MQNAAVEPLLPIEKKLIGWSLGIGLVLLVVLLLLNHFAPVTCSLASRGSRARDAAGRELRPCGAASRMRPPFAQRAHGYSH